MSTGQQNRRSRLNAANMRAHAAEVVARHDAGERVPALSAAFGVSETTVWNLLHAERAGASCVGAGAVRTWRERALKAEARVRELEAGE